MREPSCSRPLRDPRQHPPQFLHRCRELVVRPRDRPSRRDVRGRRSAHLVRRLGVQSSMRCLASGLENRRELGGPVGSNLAPTASPARRRWDRRSTAFLGTTIDVSARAASLDATTASAAFVQVTARQGSRTTVTLLAAQQYRHPPQPKSPVISPHVARTRSRSSHPAWSHRRPSSRPPDPFERSSTSIGTYRSFGAFGPPTS
jgi:hypothetical protein